MKKLFVGSSSESKWLAESAKAYLMDIVDVDIWYQDFFKLGQNTLQTLIEAAKSKYDFAVFILGPDDPIRYRGESGTTPRGNVLFELGLFMGALGGDRVFGMFSDQKDLLIPSDFAGITIAMYKSDGLDLSDFSSCKAATKGACDKIRMAILEYKSPAPVRNDILTARTVEAISSYLSFKQEDVRIAVVADGDAALKQFDDDCHEVMSGSHIHDAIKKALGTQFGLYVQAIGAVDKQPEEMRFLNCCIRLSKKRGGMTYLDQLLLRDPIRPKAGDLDRDMARLINKGVFGHWLLSTGLDPAPLAVVIDFSEKSAWDAKIIAAHKTPLGFEIDVSATSKNFGPARTKLLNGDLKLALGGLDDRFEPLQNTLSDDDGTNYMGKIIRSALFIPVQGWPGITLQILTRERIEIDVASPEMKMAYRDPEDSSIRLTIDELMSIRLCGERLQGLLAHKVSPMSHD